MPKYYSQFKRCEDIPSSFRKLKHRFPKQNNTECDITPVCFLLRQLYCRSCLGLTFITFLYPESWRLTENAAGNMMCPLRGATAVTVT